MIYLNVILSIINTLMIGLVFLWLRKEKEFQDERFERFKDWLWGWMLREDEVAPFPPTQEEVKKEIKKYKSEVYNPSSDPMMEFTGRQSDYF